MCLFPNLYFLFFLFLFHFLSTQRVICLLPTCRLLKGFDAQTRLSNSAAPDGFALFIVPRLAPRDVDK